MSESPEPTRPAIEHEAQQDIPYVLRLVRKAATLEGVAGVGGTILVILYGIASWKGFFDLYWPIIQVTGGVAETIFQFLAFPAVPIVLIYLFILYLVFLTDTEEGTARATWLPIVGWFSFIATFCTLLSVLMFVCFIDTSGIPDGNCSPG